MNKLHVSIHAFRGEGDGALVGSFDSPFVFQSTPSGGKATWDCPLIIDEVQFQSTPSGGKATTVVQMLAKALERFQSTPSGGKATPARRCIFHRRKGFNPRLPGGRRPGARRRPGAACAVSIHAFRGEGDHAA